MRKNNLNKKSGFTLIEILVAVSIFALFLAVSSNSLVDVLRLEQKANVLRKTQQNTRYILEAIVREARNANGEFIQIGQSKERVASAYQFEPTGELVITSTDFENNKVTEKVYYNEGEVIKMDVLSKPIGASAFVPENTGIALNNVEDTKITQFNFNGSEFYTNLELPPLLRITIEAESGEGQDANRVELRAHTLLESSATPRSY